VGVDCFIMMVSVFISVGVLSVRGCVPFHSEPGNLESLLHCHLFILVFFFFFSLLNALSRNIPSTILFYLTITLRE
jgi:hypothetical protein